MACTALVRAASLVRGDLGDELTRLKRPGSASVMAFRKSAPTSAALAPLSKLVILWIRRDEMTAYTGRASASTTAPN
jgi:hypothetical protein